MYHAPNEIRLANFHKPVLPPLKSLRSKANESRRPGTCVKATKLARIPETSKCVPSVSL